MTRIPSFDDYAEIGGSLGHADFDDPVSLGFDEKRFKKWVNEAETWFMYTHVDKYMSRYELVSSFENSPELDEYPDLRAAVEECLEILWSADMEASWLIPAFCAGVIASLGGKAVNEDDFYEAANLVLV